MCKKTLKWPIANCYPPHDQRTWPPMSARRTNRSTCGAPGPPTPAKEIGMAPISQPRLKGAESMNENAQNQSPNWHYVGKIASLLFVDRKQYYIIPRGNTSIRCVVIDHPDWTWWKWMLDFLANKLQCCQPRSWLLESKNLTEYCQGTNPWSCRACSSVEVAHVGGPCLQDSQRGRPPHHPKSRHVEGVDGYNQLHTRKFDPRPRGCDHCARNSMWVLPRGGLRQGWLPISLPSRF